MNLISKKEHKDLLSSFAQAAKESEQAASMLEPYAIGALKSARDSGYIDLYKKYVNDYKELGILQRR